MNIDKLEIEITASTQNASEHIKKLNKSLGDLNTSLGNLNASKLYNMAGGIRNLATAMETLHSATNGRDFTNLTKWIGKINGVSSQTTNEIATGIKNLGSALSSVQSASAAGNTLSNVANAMQKFGYKSINQALINIPKITTSLTNMLTALSRAPKVSKQVTQLINALTRLAAQGQKVGTASKAIDKALKSNDKSFSGFKIRVSNVIGVMYALYGGIMQVTRALRKLGEYLKEAIKNANEYGETFNYFEKSFGVIASKGYEEAGYKSAESYYEALKKGVMDASGKLSGIMANNGRLGLFGGKNLGLNATDTLRYQTQFTQIADSMGVASQNADRLGQVLIRLGGDLGSLKDEDYDKVWKNLTSGMVGMSRTMDKYGVNIRNAALEQTLLDLGINASIDDLGQEDKVLLRIITTLRGTQGAWGDLAETINSNANQLRMLQANWQKLSMIIGGMFAGALAKVLPIINAVMVALQKLASFVANLFGLTMDFSSSGVGGDVSEWSDYFDEMGESAGGAANDVKKLKNQLLGIDELNVLSTQDKASGGGGVGGGGLNGLLSDAFMEETQKYLDVWNNAFKEMEDKVSGIVKKIENSEAYKTLKKLFTDIKNGDWEGAGGDVSKLFTITVDGFTELLTSVDWGQIGRNVGEFLAGMDWSGMGKTTGKLIWSILKGGVDFVAQMYLEFFFKTADKKLPYWIGYILGRIWGWLVEEVKTWPEKIKEKLNIWQTLEDIETDVRNFFDLLKVDAAAAFAYISGLIISKFTKSSVSNNLNGMKTGFSGTLATVGINTSTSLANILDSIRTWFSSDKVKEKLSGITSGFTTVMNTAKSIVELIANAIKNAINAIFGSSSNFTFSGLLNAFTSPFTSAISYLNDIINKINQINGMQINVSASSVADLGANIINAVADVVKEETKKTPTTPGKTTTTTTYKGSKAGMPTNIPKYASGGIPNMGSLFWAGEAGPELIGTIGNSNTTAVASNGEITGISDTIRATSSAEMQLLRQQNELLMQIVAKPMGITESELFNSVRKSANNYTQMTGNLAF